MLELCHNALSTCSQKVRLLLAEKSLDFESHPVDLVSGGQHDPEYVKLNPNHVVSTLIDGGRVLTESSLINEYLDDAYPDTPLRPADAASRHAMRLWIKRIDEKVHPAASVITFAIGTRQALLNQPEAVREANLQAIPDPARRWLSGDDFGLADAAVLPYLLRLDHLAMTPLLEARPRAAGRLASVQARPSYASAVSGWLPDPVLKMFRASGEAVWADVESLLA